MHMAMAIGTIVWFGEVVWLVGSVLLGTIWFAAFCWYVTRRR
jgi:hypothetical protein